MTKIALATAITLLVFAIGMASAAMQQDNPSALSAQESESPQSTDSSSVATSAPMPTGSSSLMASTQSELVLVPEGTDVRIRFLEKISSETAAEGDQFTIEVDEDVEIDGKVVILEGSRGRGEVVSAKKKGFVGKGGELNIRLNYIRVGPKRVRLTGQRGKAGDDKLGTTVALTVLFGPLGLLKRGKETGVMPGQVITAYVDRDVELPFPAQPIPDRDD